MNKFKLGLLLFIPLIFSCKKVLDTSPYGSITDASAFSTASKCALVLNGVYDAAQGDYYVTGTTENRGYPFGAASIYQADARGEDLVNIQAFLQITYQATYNSSNANSAAMWKGLYELINKANIAIAGFRQAGGNGIITSTTATQYEGECRLLRAMAHHEALLHFARPYLENNGAALGVPWRDFPINSSAAVAIIQSTPRPTVATVYTNILADLDYAETNLPAASGGISYRATKAAAIALKMRVKMHKGDWAGVKAEGDKLINPVTTLNTANPSTFVCSVGGYTLTPLPDGPFVNNNSNESIFSIKNDALDAPSTNGGLSRLLGSASIPVAAGRGLVSISPIIYNDPQWLCDDKRRTGSNALIVSGTNSAGTLSWFTTKYRDYASWSDYAPMIRFAEVFLMQAEAEARVNGLNQRAVDLLNMVRNRSLANLATQQYTVAGFANVVALIKAILFERRIEFLAEGKRWGDISRLANDANYTTGGIPAKALNGTSGSTTATNPPFNCGAGYTPGQAGIPYSDFRFLWPIPITEITTNPVIVQNPGY